jgi:hypothetical protein
MMQAFGLPLALSRNQTRQDAMRYVLMMCAEESLVSSPAELEVDPVARRGRAEVERRGVFVTGAQLRPVVDATTVRVRDGETMVTDGPYAETKDVVGGFSIIDCADLDEALEVAAMHPYAARGSVEVRPVWSDC